MTNSEITHEQAVEIDTRLAEIWQERGNLGVKIEQMSGYLAYLIGLEQKRDRKHWRYVESPAQILELAQQGLADDTIPTWHRRNVEDYITKVTEARERYAALGEEAKPLDALYDANRWQRFFLVQNTGGHIHSSMACHTCNMRTRFAWLPELSGLTEKEAVEAHGTILCSHCFPSAPVEWTLGLKKEADPNQCPGSGTYDIKEGTYRRTSYTGSGVGVCTHCNQGQSVTTTGKLRKHKKEARFQ